MGRIIFQILVLWSICAPSVIAEGWDLYYEVDNLRRGGTSTLTRYLSRQVLEGLVDVQYRLSQQSDVTPVFLISADNTMNAYAFRERGQPIILLTIPMITSLQHDVDALAAVIGHELAHLKLSHLFSGQMTNLVINLLELFARREIDSGLSGTGRAVADVITQLSADAAKGFYSREDEYEADTAGVQYMIAAGYNPEGAIRLHQTLNQPNSSFFSTHPTSNERISKIYALAGQGRNNQPAYNNYSSNINSRLPACSGTNVQTWTNCYGKVGPIPISGDIYEGEWENGKYKGQGSIEYSDGTKYIGKWKEGLPNGQGTLTDSNGNKYVGEFVDGKRHGQGIYTMSDGSKYAGQWEDSIPNGEGTYTFADGKIDKGIWKKGELIKRKK